VSHIQEIGDAPSSPAEDTFLSAKFELVSYGRCEIFMRDAYLLHKIPHLLQESSSFPVKDKSHPQFSGYVTLLTLLEREKVKPFDSYRMKHFIAPLKKKQRKNFNFSFF